MRNASTKSEKLFQIYELISASKNGIRKSELARRLNVERSTISRCLPDLSMFFNVYEDDNGLLFVNPTSPEKINLSKLEIVYLYLACRLMSDHIDRHNPCAASAMRKIARSLKDNNRQFTELIAKEAERIDSQSQLIDTTFIENFNFLSRSWLDKTILEIEYFSKKSEKTKVYNIVTQLIIPNLNGRSFIIIGYVTDKRISRMFRVDRIRRIQSTTDKLEPPDPDRWYEKLNHAWSIWCGEGPPIEVQIRFSSAVANRVGESQWHRSQKLKQLDNGAILASYYISQPAEMLPWIRGWGVDAEIIKPESLRARLGEEVKKMVKIYK